MEYFGENTLEQIILDLLDKQKENRNLSTQELIGKVNKVIEYFRESLLYEFDESEALEGDEFLGLGIDNDNEEELTQDRLAGWVELIKDKFQ